MKYQKVITFLLSVVVFVVTFILCQPVFMVKANYCEMEIISQRNDDGESINEPIQIPNLKFLKMDYQNIYYSTIATELKETPNIILKQYVNMPIGERAVILNETDEWRTILWEGKIYYISKLIKSSLPVSKPEIEENTIEQTEDNNVSKPEEPSYTIEEVDKEQYVSTSSLNVRTGPGTNYKKIDSLSLNYKVHVVGITNNGWSKIEYKDDYAFVHSSYLSNKKTEVTSTTSGNKLSDYPDAYGILRIPSIGIDVVLYSSSIYSSSQWIVDNKNSAAYLLASDSYGFNIIADHAHQGFSAIQYSKPTQTVAYLEKSDGTQKYVCTAKIVGKNTGTKLVDENGVFIGDLQYGNLVMYTCYPRHPDVMIVYWQSC